MLEGPVSRRNFVIGLGASSLLGSTNGVAQVAPQTEPMKAQTQSQLDSRARRIQWWQEAKFGMFIHWGLYSVIGHQEWVM
jgi:alpha-L-fucosidase